MILFLLMGITVYSQEPSPTPLKTSNHDQTISTKNTNDSSNDHCITYDGVGSVKIYMNPTIAKNKADDNTNNSNDNTSTNWWIMIATIVIAVFAGCQFVAMFLQYCAMDKQAKGLLESVKLTEKSFIASHPPRLRVHSISLDISCLTIGGIDCIGSKIQCFIDNIGESDAEIIKSTFDFQEFKILPSVLPYGENYPTPERTIKPGGHTMGEFFLNDQIDEAILSDLRLGTYYYKYYYFFGYIDYLDNIGTKRRTAFCRQYNPTTRRFTAIDDDDYEYSYK